MLVAHAHKAFCHDDDAVAWDREMRECFAEDLFGEAVGVYVCLHNTSIYIVSLVLMRDYCIPCINPLAIRILDKWQRLLLAQDPGLPVRCAVGHASEDDFGDFQARVAET